MSTFNKHSADPMARTIFIVETLKGESKGKKDFSSESSYTVVFAPLNLEKIISNSQNVSCCQMKAMIQYISK